MEIIRNELDDYGVCMKIRFLLPLAFAALVFCLAPSMLLAEDQQNAPDPFPSMNVDECMESGTTTGSVHITCNDSYGCPQCGMNQKLTGAVCYRVYGNWAG